MANFYKLNRDYIRSFQRNVSERFNSHDKRSETAMIKSILREINELFRKIGGRVSKKRDIPTGDEYPDSEKYNRLLSDIGFDIDKIYNAQGLVESDINNLLNFNSVQREKTFESLTTTQQLVYSAYIKSKKDVVGGFEVPAGNPFTSADNMSPESEGVFIDEIRSVLTLAHDSITVKPIDVKNTTIYFAGKMPDRPIYPNGDTMSPGSHWMKSQNDPHFINTDDIGALERYKTMLIDSIDNNRGVGIAEFEAVRTESYGVTAPLFRKENRLVYGEYGQPIIRPIFSSSKSEASSILKLKSYIGELFGKDPELVYMDLANSLQGEFVTQVNLPTISLAGTNPQYRLIVPFSDSVMTNEITIELAANSEGYIPRINWHESKVYSNVGGSDVAYSLVMPATDERDVSTDGRYILHTTRFVSPTRLELVIEYDSDALMWAPIDFYMAHYVYSDQQTYEMPYQSTGNKILLTLKKSYDIFVDAEANRTKERMRALNVLRTPGRSNR